MKNETQQEESAEASQLIAEVAMSITEIKQNRVDSDTKSRYTYNNAVTVQVWYNEYTTGVVRIHLARQK